MLNSNNGDAWNDSPLSSRIPLCCSDSPNLPPLKQSEFRLHFVLLTASSFGRFASLLLSPLAGLSNLLLCPLAGSLQYSRYLSTLQGDKASCTYTASSFAQFAFLSFIVLLELSNPSLIEPICKQTGLLVPSQLLNSLDSAVKITT